ncbi:MAG: tRNA (cytidine(34)-2'-O)-methyltransferase [Gemmatimonadetes bacterium]|nr:tRNA (cytidine(34)-2'-O)-methyltransferase [Gemmatimonadota bacterium]
MAERAEPTFHVVLVQPLIPQNTGTIGRLCVAAGARLHLVGPLGFDLDDRRRRRAGLDYWPHLSWRVYDDLGAFLRAAKPPEARSWYAVARSGRAYADAAYRRGDWLFFGTETEGLPPDLWGERPDRRVTIPMRPEARSINLAIAAGIVLYEGLRQTGWLAGEGASAGPATGGPFS